MSQGERVRKIRKTLNLTLEKFGENLGVAKTTISRIETGVNSLTEQMAKSICREYNVNYDYLINGNGDPFSDAPQTILDELCEQYKCDALDRSIIQEYLELDDDDRKALKEYVRKIAMRIASEDKNTIAPQTPAEMERMYDPVDKEA